MNKNRPKTVPFKEEGHTSKTGHDKNRSENV